MAEQKFSARVRAAAGITTSGVTHVRTRLDADFTVIANALAQRRGSAITVGVAAYILSLPDGAPVTVAALCAHFSEGEIRISRALRELEAEGYLERRRVRDARGAIRTRTLFYDVPGGESPGEPEGPPEPPEPDGPGPGGAALPVPAPVAPEGPRTAAVVAEVPGPAAPAVREDVVAAAPAAPDDDDVIPRAIALLASLRATDPRLILSRREAAFLAPSVAEWLAAGVGPAQLTRVLTDRLPDEFRTRPARVLGWRLRETPLPVPAEASPPPPAVLPWQTCDGGCDRVFRAAHPGTCRDCRDGTVGGMAA